MDAVEPALSRAHTVINNGAKHIVIVSGDNNVISFDPDSKAYIKSSTMSPDDEFQDVSVSSLNALEGSGRVFMHSLGRTVPFTVHKRAELGTIAALSESLNRYASEKPSNVEIRFRRMIAADGRVKKLILLGARIPDD